MHSTAIGEDDVRHPRLEDLEAGRPDHEQRTDNANNGEQLALGAHGYRNAVRASITTWKVIESDSRPRRSTIAVRISPTIM